MIVNGERVSRAEFEAVLHENARQAASDSYAERQAALDAIMHAFDGAVRTRYRPRYRRTVDVSASAEVSRQFAQVEHHDCDELTAARRALLLAGAWHLPASDEEATA